MYVTGLSGHSAILPDTADNLISIEEKKSVSEREKSGILWEQQVTPRTLRYQLKMSPSP